MTSIKALHYHPVIGCHVATHVWATWHFFIGLKNATCHHNCMEWPFIISMLKASYPNDVEGSFFVIVIETIFVKDFACMSISKCKSKGIGPFRSSLMAIH
jgi:hypothetical protein